MRQRCIRLLIQALWRATKLRMAMNSYLFRRSLGEAGRVYAWKKLGVKITEPVRLGAGLEIPQLPENVTIGEGSKLTGHTTIISWKPVTIGRNVIFNDEVCLLAGSHDPDSPHFGGASKPITIGDFAWLPMRIMVLPGVDIGYAAVVGTGSVVVKDVPDYAIVGGSPAKIIGQRAKVDFTYRPAQGIFGPQSDVTDPQLIESP
jgi:acetyltransferase-like isoleucine patch superfamily enzyme